MVPFDQLGDLRVLDLPLVTLTHLRLSLRDEEHVVVIVILTNHQVFWDAEHCFESRHEDLEEFVLICIAFLFFSFALEKIEKRESSLQLHDILMGLVLFNGRCIQEGSHFVDFGEDFVAFEYSQEDVFLHFDLETGRDEFEESVQVLLLVEGGLGEDEVVSHLILHEPFQLDVLHRRVRCVYLVLERSLLL
jgi:hypothetical protein